MTEKIIQGRMTVMKINYGNVRGACPYKSLLAGHPRLVTCPKTTVMNLALLGMHRQ